MVCAASLAPRSLWLWEWGVGLETLYGPPLCPSRQDRVGVEVSVAALWASPCEMKRTSLGFGRVVQCPSKGCCWPGAGVWAPRATAPY